MIYTKDSKLKLSLKTADIKFYYYTEKTNHHNTVVL